MQKEEENPVITRYYDSLNLEPSSAIQSKMRGISAEALIAIEWLFIAIAFCLIIARINLRLLHLKTGFVLSDAFIAAAFAAGVSLNAVDITLYLRGVYEPDVDFKMTNWVATEAEAVYVYRTLYFLYFPFYFEQYFNKGTLLSLYYEIFGKGSNKIRVSLWCLVAYCAAGFITTMCMILFYCKWGCYWSYTDTCPQRCWTVSDNLGWAFHFSSDVFSEPSLASPQEGPARPGGYSSFWTALLTEPHSVFILPLVYISKLNMSKALKISASVTFSIGLVNILITLARWFVVQAVFTDVPALNTGQALAVVDGHIGLIVSILPSLRPYLRLWQIGNDSRPAKSNPISEDLTTVREGTPLASRVASSLYDSNNNKAEEASRV
ncbi:hypothetical protein CTA2_7607 [Colletotrichum tanaceti]|uniref:Archaeal flagellin n-terminal-like domain-containing protein n=1 Tax=Colletotrichum tanaceti TaxID=1306861 RepID=A0A4U6XH07_9PEZI|nr:hypothetical protein CTA2_7607 [Colletotrichum tanaceti]TKW54894.1 hypothetical protein CTA1_479 [Colletotrichum tanaceti]